MATKLPANMKPTDSVKSDINILLLGETGVGKSTFINSFVNYLEYTDLNTAEKSPLICVIPAKFTIPDENFKERIVEIGSDKNENKDVGESATLGTRAYVFPLKDGNRKIRIIDTPGIGDTKGLEQDDANFENILSYISQFRCLHAICFLLKPNVSRINVYFKYCLQHLLTHLEKSASLNIVFVFTNTRSTFYRPGETLSSLNKVLKTLEDQPPHVKIPCSKENMFCFDNEAFKFLVALKHDITFSEQEKKDFGSSWESSVNACWNMLGYIVGDKKRAGLKPHLVQNTLSVNEARRLIINLSKPLADISELINDNITVMNRHQGRIMQENMSKEELMQILYVPTINLRKNKLTRPVTVCTNVACCVVYAVAGKNKYDYKQKCHNPCYLINVPKQIVGSPELLGCAAMARTQTCTQCNCDFSSHMHIYYETVTFEDKIENEGVKQQIKTAEDVIEAQFTFINNLKKRQAEYDSEKNVISKAMAKFAHFLQENSITPYNDAFADYVRYLINREQGLGPNRNMEVIQNYEDDLKRHEQEKKVLDAALLESKKVDVTSAIITALDVFASVKDLYKLKHNGAYIKQFHELQENARRHEHEDSVEYHHFNPIAKRKQEKKKTKQMVEPETPEALDMKEIKAMLLEAIRQKKAVKVTEKAGKQDISELDEIKIKLKQLTDAKLASPLKEEKQKVNENKQGHANRGRGRGFHHNNRGAVPKVGQRSNNFGPSPNYRGNSHNPNNFRGNYGNNPRNQNSGNRNNQFGKQSDEIPSLIDQPNSGNPSRTFYNKNQFPNQQNSDNPSGYGNNSGNPNFPTGNTNSHGNPNFGGNNPNFSSHNPNYGGNSPNVGGNNPNFAGNNPNFAGNNPNFAGNNPNNGGNNPNFGVNNPNFGGNNSNNGGSNPYFGGNNPNFGGNNPNNGGNNPNFGGNNPNNGGNNPNNGGNNPTFGGNNPNYDSNYGGNNPNFAHGNPNSNPNFSGNNTNYAGNNPNYVGNNPNFGRNQNTYGRNQSYGNRGNDEGNNFPGNNPRGGYKKNTNYGRENHQAGNNEGYGRNNDVNRRDNNQSRDMDHLNNFDKSIIKDFSKELNHKSHVNKDNNKSNFKKYNSKRPNAKVSNISETTSVASSSSNENSCHEAAENTQIKPTNKSTKPSLDDMKLFLEQQKKIWAKLNVEETKTEELTKKKSFFDKLFN